MAEVKFKVFRGEGSKGELCNYNVEVTEGMVVLDAIHQIQSRHANDLAVRWNCKAGKCGSCSAEVNGKSRLMCMTRMEDIMEETPEDSPVVVKPMQAFPLTKDLVADVQWAYDLNKTIPALKGPDEMDWKFDQI